MCEDDYYDYEDDDYYDDDEYWEEEEEHNSNYQEQERVRKEQPTPNKNAPPVSVKSTSIAASSPLKKEVKISVPSSSSSASILDKERTEKERLVISMGFTSDKARASLENHGWDVQQAINDLLSNPEISNDKSMTMAPPPKFMPPPPALGDHQGRNATLEFRVGTTKKDKKIETSEFPSVKVSSHNTKSVNLSGVDLPKSSQKLSSNASLSTSSKVSEAKIKTKTISPEMKKKLESQKSRLSMVILGHVDAGKSTLMGQVLVQMGMVQNRTVAKYQKEASEIGKASFALAWIMDEDESERERGVTIDIATKYITTENHDLTILDAPGHADYIPAMITGAGVSDVGILVVSSTKGEFESGFDLATGKGGTRGHVGQTREHITLAKALGVSQLIVAVNKLDAADPAWSQSRFNEIQSKLEPFLKQSGFNLRRVQFVPISGLTGINVKKAPSKDDAASAGLAEWYNGKTLMMAINSFEPAKRNIDKPFRFIVSDLYPEGKGLVVKGRVAQGIISAGDEVVVLPTGDIASVTRIDHGVVSAKANDDFDAERVKIALAGDSCDLIIGGIDIARICTGNILSDVPMQLRPKLKKTMKAQILVLDDLSVPIIRGSQVLMHMHCLDVPAVISNIISKLNKKDGSTIPRPRVLTGGSNATVQIKLQERICLERYSDCRSLGRFVLRRGGDTVAIGIIEDLED
jgi:Translation elongation factor EF-1alpha (GTPase)